MLNYVGGFLGLVFVHTTVKKYELETLDPFDLRWTRFFFTYLIGFGLVLTVTFSLAAFTIWLNVCQIPGILNSYKTAIEFREFKSALLQEGDVSSHCQHDWQWSSVSEESGSVDHYLNGSRLTIHHKLTKFPIDRLTADFEAIFKNK